MLDDLKIVLFFVVPFVLGPVFLCGVLPAGGAWLMNLVRQNFGLVGVAVVGIVAWILIGQLGRK